MPFMSKKRHKIKERELKGFKYFKTISKILESLHDVGCQRDLAGSHSRYVIFQMAEVAVPRMLFREILDRIWQLHFLTIPARPG